jgi:hypothetical protein
MIPRDPENRRWLLVAIYAIAMAWIESATVYYLRTMVDRVEPYQDNPLPIVGTIGLVELAREASTLVMLLTVGALAGRTTSARLGYAAIAFGIWDIFYYVFLRLMTGWPRSVFDWDILFLLPLPWWGPVIAPVSIALLMIAWGTLVSRHSDQAGETTFSSTSWRLSWLGIALALYVFMADAIASLPNGLEATRLVLPRTFNWLAFATALLLMSAPVAQIAWRAQARR